MVGGVDWQGYLRDWVLSFPDEPAGFEKRGKRQLGVARCRDRSSAAGRSGMVELHLGLYVNVMVGLDLVRVEIFMAHILLRG